MDKDNSLFTCLGLLIYVVILVVAGSIMSGWALSVLWGWFVVPLFDVPSLTIPYALGLGLVIGLFIPATAKSTSDDATILDMVIHGLVKAFCVPLLAVFIGWILLGFL